MQATKKRTRFLPATLSQIGQAILILTFIYFIFGSPVMAYSGPHPEEASAYFEWRAVTFFMICASGVILSILMMFLGRTRKAHQIIKNPK